MSSSLFCSSLRQIRCCLVGIFSCRPDLEKKLRLSLGSLGCKVHLFGFLIGFYCKYSSFMPIFCSCSTSPGVNSALVVVISL